VIAQAASQRYACVISGLPGHEIEDLHIHNVRLIYPGGGTGTWTKKEPSEQLKGYPDPTRFGGGPAYGFYIRHVNGIELTDIQMSTSEPDVRAPFVATDVQGLCLDHVSATRAANTPMLMLDGVKDFQTENVDGVANVRLKDVGREDF
jgi:hypothetical protein